MKLAMIVLVLLVGCSDSDPDVGSTDARPGPDASTTDANQADLGVADSGVEAGVVRDAGHTDLDAGVDAGLDAGADAGLDAGVPDPGPVQCRIDSDCGGNLTCNKTAPGGICLGCGTCPGMLECYAGACVRDCVDDTDCNAGFRCAGTRCGLRSCSPTEPCPAPYECGSNDRCARPSCGSGCPAPLVCDGTLCMEP